MSDITSRYIVGGRLRPQAGSLNKRCRSNARLSSFKDDSAALSELHSTIRKQQQVILLQQQQLCEVEKKNQVLLKLVSALVKKLADVTKTPHERSSSFVSSSPRGSEVQGVKTSTQSDHLSHPISKTKELSATPNILYDAPNSTTKKRKTTSRSHSSIARAAAAVARRVKAAKAAAATEAAAATVAAASISADVPTATATLCTYNNRLTAKEHTITSLSDEEMQQILEEELMQQLLNNPAALSAGVMDPQQQQQHNTTLLQCTAAASGPAAFGLPAAVPAASQFTGCQPCDQQRPESQMFGTHQYLQQQHLMPLLRFSLGNDYNYQGQQMMTVADGESGTLPAVLATVSTAVDSSSGDAMQRDQHLTGMSPHLNWIAEGPAVQSTAGAAAAAISNSHSIATTAEEFDNLLDLPAFEDPMDCFDWML